LIDINTGPWSSNRQTSGLQFRANTQSINSSNTATSTSPLGFFARGKLPRFVSKLDVTSKQFKQNSEDMKQLLLEMKEKLEYMDYQGKEARVKAHKSKNKLLARQRLELLLDQDSPFLEIAPYAGLDILKDQGQECMYNGMESYHVFPCRYMYIHI
jgi:Sec-independent protein translocase protein TatA